MGSFLETEIDPFKGRRMVFASTAIFLRARAEIKNLLCEQRAVWRVQLASSEHFLYRDKILVLEQPLLEKS